MIEAYPLTWPEGWPRTPSHRRKSASFGKVARHATYSYKTKKQLSIADGTRRVQTELERLGDQYEYYGKPHLREISELVGFDWRKHDNGYWRNGEFEKGVPADQVARLIQPEPEA